MPQLINAVKCKLALANSLINISPHHPAHYGKCVRKGKRFLRSSITTLWSHSLRGWRCLWGLHHSLHSSPPLSRVSSPSVWWEPCPPPPPSLTWMNTLSCSPVRPGSLYFFLDDLPIYTVRWAPGCSSHPAKLKLGTPAGCSSPGVLQLVGGPPLLKRRRSGLRFARRRRVVSIVCETTQSVWYRSQNSLFSASPSGAPAARGRSRCWWCVFRRQLPPIAGEWGWSGRRDWSSFSCPCCYPRYHSFHPSLRS